MGKVNHQLLTTDAEGLRVLASTPTDVNAKVPRLLEVNKSVIENVMFCHQEHSTWPFSDNTTLKKIFDDLFDTRKNVKMVDNIRKMGVQVQLSLEKVKYQLQIDSNTFKEKRRLLMEYSSQTRELREIRDSICLLDVKLSAFKNPALTERDTKEDLLKQLGVLQFQYDQNQETRTRRLTELDKLKAQEVSKQELTSFMVRRVLREQGEINTDDSDDSFLNYFGKTPATHDFTIEDTLQRVTDVGITRKKWFKTKSKLTKKNSISTKYRSSSKTRSSA